jgi:Putative zinc dependent peptidase (DUF5700)
MRILQRFCCLLCIALSCAVCPAIGQAAPDFTQAEAMLHMLRSCHNVRASAAEIEHVLSLPGTQLVMQQQNISRRVTPEQYRTVLQAACNGKMADLKPAEPGARAEKGVAGLIQDVAPSLLWGRDHIDELTRTIKDLRSNREIGGAIPLARKYLPEPVALRPKLYVVMGGRAGAAGIENQLYFDVLITNYRASRGSSISVSAKQVVEFFAHETHHLGYGQILDRKRAALNFTPAESQVWDFLVAVLMEGSATLLINGHENLNDLQKQPDAETYLAKVPELLPQMEDLLLRALARPISQEEYAEATGPFLDMGYHATGAVLLAAIKQRRGLAGVLHVMDDPRELMAAYNECAGASTVSFRFDPVLASRVASVGESRPQ